MVFCFFSVLYYEIILDLEETCKNSTEGFQIYLIQPETEKKKKKDISIETGEVQIRSLVTNTKLMLNPGLTCVYFQSIN